MPAADPPIPSKRVQFVDLLRGWAVIVMIETHVMNATLRADIREGVLFQIITFVNGLVAPSFIFASGMAFAITAHRKRVEYATAGWPLFRQILRLLVILALGYMLHLPRFSLQYLAHEATGREWEVFFMVDVLQCIAVTLLVLQTGFFVLKNEERLYRAAAIGAVGVLLVTPPMWGFDFAATLPFCVATYLNGLHKSLFPLFPWSAFLLAGAVTGYVFVRAREASASIQGADATLMKRAAWFALGIMAVSFVLHPLGSAIYEPYDYWRTSPSFVLLRLGLVLLLMAGFFLFERLKGVSTSSAVTLMGRESLVVYVGHLLLIYGNFGTFTLHKAVNKGFGYLEGGALTIVLIVAMFFLARGWSSVRQLSPRWRRALYGGLTAVLVGVFLFGPSH